MSIFIDPIVRVTDEILSHALKRDFIHASNLPM